METNNFDIVFHQFNLTIEQWIHWLDDYTLDRLQQQPRTDSWSLGQVYVHIIDDTNYFIERAREALSNNDNEEKQMHEDAKIMFENNAFPDIQIKGPATGSSVPQPENKEVLRQGLLSIKEAINQIHSDPDLSGSTGKTEHPGLQFFTAGEWIQLIEMHLRHHFRQKMRIDEQLGLPIHGNNLFI